MSALNSNIVNAGSYATYAGVFGRSPSINELRGLLTQMSGDTVLCLVAWVNNRACMLPNGDELWKVQSELMNLIFTSDDLKKLTEFGVSEDLDQIVFFRQQQLLLLREALTTCSFDRPPDFSQGMLRRFGIACLMASDLLWPDENETDPANLLPKERCLITLRNSMPISELVTDNDFQCVVGRSVQLWMEIPDALEKSAEITDFNILFEQVYGIRLDMFLRILYIILTKTMISNPEDKLPWLQFGMDVAQIVEMLSCNSEVVERAFAMLSCSPKELSLKVFRHVSQSMGTDFTILERYPFIEVSPGKFMICDTGFVQRFFMQGIFWRIEDSLTATNREKYRAFFGRVFEEYIGRCLKTVYDVVDAGGLYLDARFNNNDQVSDAIIEIDESWTIMEAKGVLLTTKAKYGGDITFLQNDLTQKFVSKGSQKLGVGQLARTIRRLVCDRIQIKNSTLSIDHCKVIYPVLVIYDPSMSGMFASHYLNFAFKDELGTLPADGPTVMPLSVLTTRDIEYFTCVGRRLKLHELLAGWHQYGQPYISFADYATSGGNSTYVQVSEGIMYANAQSLHEAAIGNFRQN